MSDREKMREVARDQTSERTYIAEEIIRFFQDGERLYEEGFRDTGQLGLVEAMGFNHARRIAAERERVKEAIEAVSHDFAKHWSFYDDNCPHHEPYNVWVRAYTTGLDALKAKLDE